MRQKKTEQETIQVPQNNRQTDREGQAARQKAGKVYILYILYVKWNTRAYERSTRRARARAGLHENGKRDRAHDYHTYFNTDRQTHTHTHTRGNTCINDTYMYYN